jgi:hypothetical protein
MSDKDDGRGYSGDLTGGEDTVWQPSTAVRHAVDGAHDPDLSAAEMPGMDLAIDITVAAEQSSYSPKSGRACARARDL